MNQHTSHLSLSEHEVSVFVTVGTDQPFDRMVKVIDEWAAENPTCKIFAQIGDTNWTPQFIEFTQFLDPIEFAQRIEAATLIIGHAGMGTILTSLRHQKPTLVVPKRASLGEHRNEHQLATARNLLKKGKVNVAFDEAELRESLDKIESLSSTQMIGPFAETSLTDNLASFINDPSQHT